MINEFYSELLDKPSIDTERCAICSARATNRHHIVQKGMGGTKLEKRIPTMKLCGSGTSGCHGMAHDKRLHIYWDDERDGWVYYVTRKPMNDFRCWQVYGDRYMPVPGWQSREVEETFGDRR